MPFVLNWASTWANHTSGSAGQKGGSLIATADKVAGSGATSPSGAMLSRTVQGRFERVERSGHQLLGLPLVEVIPNIRLRQPFIVNAE